MRKPLALWLIIALALSSITVVAGANGDEIEKSEVDLLIERVEAARMEVDRLEADVVHERVVPVMDLEEKFEGSFLFEKPHLLRMELKENIENGRERIYIVGEEIAWIVHPKRKQAEKAAVATDGLGAETRQEQNPFTYGLTHGIGELRKTFNMEIMGEDEIGDYKTTILELTPRPEVVEGEGRNYPKTVFWIDKETSLPVRVRQFKSRGQIIETYTLSELEVNPRVWIRLRNPFTYSPPRDFQVIDYGEDM